LDVTTPVTRELQQHSEEAASKAAAEKELKRLAIQQQIEQTEARKKLQKQSDSDSSDDEDASVALRVAGGGESDELASEQYYRSRVSIPRALFQYLRALIALVYSINIYT
jgi:hypothetical protein